MPTTPIIISNPGAALSNIHIHRVPGQGYCSVQDVLEELSSERIESLEEYLEVLSDGGDVTQVDLSDAQKQLLRKIKAWIPQYAGYCDDRIRVKYTPPFPDYPYSPQALRLANKFFVVHQTFVYNGLYGGNNKDEEGSYFGKAETILDKIVAGELLLQTDYTLPLVNGSGVVVGSETIEIGLTGQIIEAHTTLNPLSMANQDREFGFAVTSKNGGSGYKQVRRNDDGSIFGIGRDRD